MTLRPFLSEAKLTEIANFIGRKINGPPVTKWKVKVKVAQSCLTLCDPMVYTVHGILHARILEWVAFPFSRASSWPRNRTGVSCITGRFFTSWATREALQSQFLPNWLLHISRWTHYRLRYTLNQAWKSLSCNPKF